MHIERWASAAGRLCAGATATISVAVAVFARIVSCVALIAIPCTVTITVAAPLVPSTVTVPTAALIIIPCTVTVTVAMPVIIPCTVTVTVAAPIVTVAALLVPNTITVPAAVLVIIPCTVTVATLLVISRTSTTMVTFVIANPVAFISATVASRLCHKHLVFSAVVVIPLVALVAPPGLSLGIGIGLGGFFGCCLGFHLSGQIKAELLGMERHDVVNLASIGIVLVGTIV